jgi:hypothetical protein
VLCVAHGERDKERGRRTQEQDAGDHKGPRPAQPNPRPYGDEGAAEGMSHHTSPRGRPRSSLPMFVCYMRNK